MAHFFVFVAHTASVKGNVFILLERSFIVKKEIEVDFNLFHLLYVLFDLDNYTFDRDIIELLNQLHTLVNKKMFDNFPYNGVLDKNIKIIVNI